MAAHLSSDADLKAEINVTPLVDVVLVLLVVFLVVTPLLEQELTIDLPVTENGRSVDPTSQVTMSLTADERVLLNGTEVPPEELVPRLTAIYAGRTDKAIFLEADRSLSHGRIVDLMDDARAAGVIRIGVVTRKAPPGEPAGVAGRDSVPAPNAASATVTPTDPPG